MKFAFQFICCCCCAVKLIITGSIQQKLTKMISLLGVTHHCCARSLDFRLRAMRCLQRKIWNSFHPAGSACCVPSTKNYSGSRAVPLVVNNMAYDVDEWTNVTEHVLSHLGMQLHRRPHHPLCLLTQRLIDFFYRQFPNRRGNPLFSLHDDVSPIVTPKQNFDHLLVPHDHPSRRKSDSYYLNSRAMLRAHTSAHQWDLVKSGLDNFLVVGDVFRRDAIDALHYPVFHQMDGVRTCTEAELKEVSHSTGFSLFESGRRTTDRQEVHSGEAVKAMVHEMKATIEGLARRLFGFNSQLRWVDAYFPFTHPSWELEVYFNDDWLEVLGCGVMEHAILQSAGAGDKIGWAFGLGLERLAMKLYSIPDIRLFWSKDSGFWSQFSDCDMDSAVVYKPISSYPQCKNDVSFWVPDTFAEADFYDIVRSVGGPIVEQVTLIDTFRHPQTQRTSHCYRVVYRHMEKTLTQAEVNTVHKQIEDAAVKQLNVTIR